ncbi:MAG: hypothetical protein CGU28_11975 [Candidatus Dactylopiibacterium carminicum]|uniref:Uncharacterized protein n=1 Tax=Candidatus Dactylopiibacterium carminicum TaxID=857335 RepID=A0A272EUN7_9RHOO|nr:hypothetical protein BGI27_02940 [Candidatus Dactylopiibacterium carminicum]PAS93821.1 MAG: hypothetical protein CGU29_06185 [Candidatus Dactylopiibacterium carminicum]PAS95615.1 MAG: hypothetical protein CGU28_11975 [Candidatus Dactylopiibacterium carminicum]PAT00352.1 MAG: hypothetical protein BSR46_02960 [Candidatus Dactylopiibacterium carminicum]
MKDPSIQGQIRRFFFCGVAGFADETADALGGSAPQCGQFFAVELTLPPHSVHFSSAIESSMSFE